MRVGWWQWGARAIMGNVYFKDSAVRVSCTFTVNAVNTDPSTVTLKVKTPAGVTSAYTYALSQVTRSAAGVYYKDIETTEAGLWRYRWEGTGTCQATDEAAFDVQTDI